MTEKLNHCPKVMRVWMMSSERDNCLEMLGLLKKSDCHAYEEKIHQIAGICTISESSGKQKTKANGVFFIK